MPPLQQTQKEKHQGRRTNPYRRPRLATHEFFGSQFEWTQAQQLHSNTVENEWQNMTSNEFCDNTNDYDDNEKPSIKQLNEQKVVMVAASLENSSRKNSDINTKRGVVEQNDSMVQPLEQREPVSVLGPPKWSNIINNNNQFNNITNNNSQFNNSYIPNNRQFGGFVAQNSSQINNNFITNNNGPNSVNNIRNSVIANNNGRNGVIANSNGRNNVIANSNGRNNVIINSNGRNNLISNGIGRNNVIIANSNGHSNIMTNSIGRNSVMTNNIGRNGVTANNNGRNNVITNNNGRSSVIASVMTNNIGRDSVMSNSNVRNNIIPNNNSQFNSFLSHNNNQASKNFVTHNSGQVSNSFVTHNQVRNNFVAHNSNQISNSFVAHNNSQFNNNQSNKGINNNSIVNNSIVNTSNNSSQVSNSQINKSIVTNDSSQVNNSKFSNGIVSNNSKITNISTSNSISNSNNSKVSSSNQVSNSNNSKISNNSNISNSSLVSNGNNSKVSNGIAANNNSQVSNNITFTENNKKVGNDIIVTNKSSEVSNSTAVINNNKVSDNNSNEINSTEQPEGSAVTISDGISQGVSGRSRKRRNGKGQGRRVRRGKGRSDVRNQDQSQTATVNTEDVKEHSVDEAGNGNKRRKIVSENDDESLAMNVDGNEEVVPMEEAVPMEDQDPNADNVNAIMEPPSSTKTPARAKSRNSRGKKRARSDRKNPAVRKPRGKRGRPNVAPETARTEDVRGSDQDESMSDVPQSLVAPVPDVPEPEPKQTIALRKYLETLRLNEQILSRDRLLRLGTYIMDHFVSQAWCRPFVNPEDESAVIYRQIITRLMDLTTVEHNLWAGEYDGSVSKFYNDLAQIIYNAFKFHPEGTIIFNEANFMLTCFVDYTTKFSKPPHDPNKLEDTLVQIGAKLPHEEFGDVCSVAPNVESRIYIVPLYSFRQVSRSGSNVAKLPQAAAERLDPMSRPLFDIFERRNLPPIRFQPTETHCNFARLYITMGAQNIKNCRDERNAILVIVKDVSYARGENRLRCNAIISKPFGELRELDTIGFPELQDARYWTRVAFLDRMTLDLKVGPKFFDKYLRTPFKVSEYDKEIITLQQHDAFLAALNLRKSNSSPEGLSIWQRLVAEANKVKVPIESLESLGKPIQVDAEGFFKRVFHVPGDDKYVVQNFKEISEGTLETRIKEAVCCLKTKGVSNTGQIRSVYKDEEYDELVGLSMERYNYTLKEYAFNTRSPITGEQKYKLIHDMMKGIKALHDAGFAHRDLSEVNMMVNNTSEKLADGSTKPELVVIDFGKAEFINRDDVIAWSVGEVTNDKLEHLPWIKTVPDHGYKLYRSAATLPRTKNDHAVLQYPIDPCSEDVYAAGVLAWRIFSGQAPWGGILDTDLKNLREIVTDPIKIKFHIEKNVNGKKSRELLLKCITAKSQDRSTAKELLDWLLQFKDELISEWATSGRVRIRKQL